MTSHPETLTGSSRSSLSGRLFFALLVMILPVLAVAGIGLRGFHQSAAGLEGFREEGVEEGKIIELIREMLVRGDDLGEAYVEEQDRAHGAAFHALARRIDGQFGRLLAITEDEEGNAAVAARGLFRQAVRDIEVAVSAEGPTEERLDSFHDRIDEAASTVATLHAINQGEIVEQISTLRAHEERQIMWLLLTLLTSTVGAYVVALRLRRSITAPLARLEEGARRLGSDDLSYRIDPIGDDELGRVSAAFNDMASRLQETRNELHHQALHDGLTGLANRTLFMEEAHRAMSRARRQGGKISILYVDLDGFKLVNDTLGHDAGDDLLRQVAGWLTSGLRAEDTVARLGGDEFGILLEDGPEGAIRVAERILALFEEGGVGQPTGMRVAASVGIATGDGDDTVEELLRRSDVAMYGAKAAGKGRWQVFGAQTDREMREVEAIRADLHGAVQRGEFLVHYQPIADLRLGVITSVEALVRWKHPIRGLLLPDRFLRQAEESGVIAAIDRWVLRTACARVRKWQQEIPAATDLSLNVNLSASRLQRGGLSEEVAEALQESGLAPRHLVLEINETTLVRDPAAARSELAQLKDLGVKLSLDDFGTGYSSLSYLLRFPIDEIKIDREFVSALGEDKRSSDLVRALVKLGESLDLRLVAEGIETESQLDYLRRIGLGNGQGYYFARPMPARMAESLLVDGSTVADLSISIPEGSEPPAVRDLGEHRGERVAPGRSKTHPRG